MKTILAKSKLTLADYYYKYRQNYKAARVFYNEAITVYPDSSVAAQARAKLVDVDARLAQQANLPADKNAPVPAQQKKKRFWLF
jgi:outer membrane protein assembly factor BamD